MTDTIENFGELYPWITNKFFEDILRTDQNNKYIKVNNITIKAALGKGENYTSQMLRVKATYSTGATENLEHSFIVKTAVSNADVDAIVHEMGLFDIEILVYRDILPQVEKLLKSIGNYAPLSAK